MQWHPVKAQHYANHVHILLNLHPLQLNTGLSARRAEMSGSEKKQTDKKKTL
jgi:hypothetical protein